MSLTAILITVSVALLHVNVTGAVIDPLIATQVSTQVVDKTPAPTMNKDYKPNPKTCLSLKDATTAAEATAAKNGFSLRQFHGDQAHKLENSIPHIMGSSPVPFSNDTLLVITGTNMVMIASTDPKLKKICGWAVLPMDSWHKIQDDAFPPS